LNIYDTHLPDYILKLLEKQNIQFLTISNLEKLIKDLVIEFDVKYAILGGGEPTIDKYLPEIVRILKSYNISIRLLTNAYLLSKDYLMKLIDNDFKISDLIVVSIKALNPDKHRFITGIDNSKILENVKLMYELGISISIETVYVPELITFDDIVNLAKWIKENLNHKIPLIIDPYVPIPELPYRKPTIKELNIIERICSKFLSNVIVRGLSLKNEYGGYIIHKGVKIGWNSFLIGNVHLIYPTLNIF